MRRRVSRPMAGSSMSTQKAMTRPKPKAMSPLASVVPKATTPIGAPWAMPAAQDAAPSGPRDEALHRVVLEDRRIADIDVVAPGDDRVHVVRHAGEQVVELGVQANIGENSKKPTTTIRRHDT